MHARALARMPEGMSFERRGGGARGVHHRVGRDGDAGGARRGRDGAGARGGIGRGHGGGAARARDRRPLDRHRAHRRQARAGAGARAWITASSRRTASFADAVRKAAEASRWCSSSSAAATVAEDLRCLAPQRADGARRAVGRRARRAGSRRDPAQAADGARHRAARRARSRRRSPRCRRSPGMWCR